MSSSPRAVRFDPGVLDRRFLGALVAALDQLLTAEQVPGPDEVSWLLPL